VATECASFRLLSRCFYNCLAANTAAMATANTPNDAPTTDAAPVWPPVELEVIEPVELMEESTHTPPPEGLV